MTISSTKPQARQLSSTGYDALLVVPNDGKNRMFYDRLASTIRAAGIGVFNSAQLVHNEDDLDARTSAYHLIFPNVKLAVIYGNKDRKELDDAYMLKLAAYSRAKAGRMSLIHLGELKDQDRTIQLLRGALEKIRPRALESTAKEAEALRA